MKKQGLIVAILLVIAMLICSVTAFAQEAESITYDQAIVTEEGIFFEDELYTGWYIDEQGQIIYCENGLLSTYTGRTIINGYYYYLLNGVRQTGFHETNGSCYFYKSNGQQAQGTGRISYNGSYYYLVNGIRQTGFFAVNGNYYFYSSNGKQSAYTGRIKYNGHYYYLKNGIRQTGFFVVNGVKYFYKSNGQQSTYTGKTKINGSYYYLKSGAVQTGWKKIDDKRYYFTSNGKMAIGKKKIGEKYFYFDKYGVAKTGMKTIDGATYYFKTSGSLGKYGASVSGWVTKDKACYYFSKKSYKLIKNDIVDSYKVDKNGASKTRYKIIKIVNKYTDDDMTENQKIKALWDYIVNNSWGYIRTYEHTSSKWKWYDGWTDDFAYDLITDKGGNCFRYAATFGYLVKEATGYPVRVYHGKTPARRGGTTPHGWITVKIDGTWYAYDPDLYKFGGRAKKYYKNPYSVTKKTMHLDGKYTAL